MAVKVFTRQGLRRDRNLSDLTAPQSALNNILATPSMLGTEKSFTVLDLAPIQQIYVTNITTSTFASLDGVTVSFTVVDENGVIDNTTNPKVYRPLIKIKNRLDTAYFSTGEPFFYGGDGPNATYYDNEQIIRDPDPLEFDTFYLGGEVVLSNNKLYRATAEAYRDFSSGDLTHTSGQVDGFNYIQAYDPTELYLSRDIDVITQEDVTISDNFWERGQFEYGNKVQNSFVSLFGGVNWQGFFKPVTSGISNFYLRTTGATVFKFQAPESPPYTPVRYGRVNTNQFNNDFSNSQLGDSVVKQRVKDALEDPTRQFIEVQLQDDILLKDSDVVYLEITEGPVIPKQYQIFTYFSEPTFYNKFFIEVTVDFNLQNIDITTVPQNPSFSTAVGYRGTARYTAYERRALKTYLNTINHKLNISESNINPVAVNQFDLDEFSYYHVMINDYIYDYRKRTTDATSGVRRWKVTNVSDTNRRVTVALDTGYTINTGDRNDQQAYIFNGLLSFTSGTQITEVYTTGNINDAIDTANTPTTGLYYVGRYGETTLRTKYITISQFLEAYVDYAFDWVYFTKDGDIDPATQNKAWLLWYRSETSGGYFRLDYKYLYDKNYSFYEIGDFKVFLDNSIGLGGTSREEGIDQRAFGAKQLVSKGDQYNQLFSLLPVRSDYTPKETWNQIALSRSATLRGASRLITLNNTTEVEVGNYIFQDSTDGFTNGITLPIRTRIVEINENNSNVVVSKTMPSSTTVNTWVMDHRGFVGPIYIPSIGDGDTDTTSIQYDIELPVNTCTFQYATFVIGPYTINYTASTGTLNRTVDGELFTFAQSGSGSVNITGPGIGQVFSYISDTPELQVGMIYVSPQDPSNQTKYRRITKLVENNVIPLGDQTVYQGTIYFDTAYTNAPNVRLGAVYYDRGIDITKPLESFCTGTACAQNRYNIEKDGVETNHIALFIGSGVIGGNDVRFTNPANGARSYINNGNAQIAEWREYQPNIQLESNFTAKTYRSNAVYAKFEDTEVENSFTDLGHPNFPVNTYVPIGYIEGMVRIRGEIYDGTYGRDVTLLDPFGGFTGQVGVDATFTVRGSWTGVTDPAQTYIQIGQHVYVNNYYCTVVNVTTSGFITLRNQSGAARNFNVADGVTLTFFNSDYYFIVRVNKSWQSLTDFDTTADGIEVGKRLDFSEFSSSQLNFRYLAFPTVQDQYYTNGGNISALSTLTSYYNSFVASNSYADRFFEITADLTLTATEVAYFLNPTSFAPLSGTTYVIPTGSYIHFSTRAGNKLVWFSSFEDFQGDYSAYSLHPTTAHKGNTTGSLADLGSTKQKQSLLSIHPQEGAPGDVLPLGSSTYSDMPFRYFHYRRQQYEILPVPYTFQQEFPYCRFINPYYGTTTGDVQSYLQNSTNKLSVYTFANTTDNKELCCPPLDTSPPFDSSPIGLATTNSEPDMYIGGLVNVRSITANHPESKIHEIPSGLSNASLPVDKKLEIIFGGVKYDLLIGDTKSF
jgi:hypothetical protein